MMLFDQGGPSPMPATATAMPPAMEGHPYAAPTAPYAVNQPPPPLQPQQQQQPSPAEQLQQPQPQHPQHRLRRKRKADAQDAHNERLSKRMSLLNLEHNGTKLYVPVEQSQIPQSSSAQPAHDATTHLDSNVAAVGSLPVVAEEEPMHLDDTSHKVYIYNLDDELSSENESDPEDREGKLVFLPDIEKHLRATRLPMVPRPILPNKDGELAGMQLVLYSDGPSSITVPEEQDSVRKAIIEARARVRQKQAEERQASVGSLHVAAASTNSDTSRTGKVSFATPVKVPRSGVIYTDMMVDGQNAGQSSASASVVPDGYDPGYDPDAMDID